MVEARRSIRWPARDRNIDVLGIFDGLLAEEVSQRRFIVREMLRKEKNEHSNNASLASHSDITKSGGNSDRRGNLFRISGSECRRSRRDWLRRRHLLVSQPFAIADRAPKSHSPSPLRFTRGTQLYSQSSFVRPASVTGYLDVEETALLVRNDIAASERESDVGSCPQRNTIY